MRVLVTSGASSTAELIAKGLSGAHEVHSTEMPGKSAGTSIVGCELGHDEETDRLCDGVETVVIVCEPGDLPETEVVDFHSRRLYNLLTAAANQGVKHVVLISSLRLFESVPDEYEIDEHWAPSLTPEPDSLKYHVAEFVCREFERARTFPVTCLRLGEIVCEIPGENEVTEAAVVQTVLAAINKRPGLWSVFHVVSEGTRFITGRVEKALEVTPRGDQ